SHPGDDVVRRHPREIDTGQLSSRAFTAVRADEIGGLQLVGPCRPADMYRDARLVLVDVLIEAGQSVAPTNVRAVFAGPLRKTLDKLGLLNRKPELLRLGDPREVQP